MNKMKRICAMAATLLLAAATTQAAEPLKIFILAGQSNMQGTAELRTLKGIGMDPETQKLADKLLDKEGNPRVYEDVRIVYFDGKVDDPLIRHGELTAGFGARTRAGDKTGLEFAFGATMYEKLKQPILIIKTAWGGKDLYHDFRPPSAGPIFPDHSKVKPRKTNRGMMPAEEVIARAEKREHVYYNAMVEHVNSVLADPGKYCPDYDKDAGYELAGFVWFQGFNDMLQGGMPFYQASEDQPAFALYTELLADLIRDLRKEFDAPKMPFVIGVIGISGDNVPPWKVGQLHLREAMAAPADMPEFKGNVVAVQTAPFWDTRIDEIHKVGSIIKTPDHRRGNKPPYSEIDPEGKYAERHAKYQAWYQAMMAAEPDKQTDRQAWRDWNRKLKAEMDSRVYSPEELSYLEANQSNAGLHYWGSGKTYSQIGQAFAKAILEMNRK